MKTPELLLEQLYLRERETVNGIDTEKETERIRRSDEEILKTYRTADMKKAVAAKMKGKTKVLPFRAPNTFFYLKAVSCAAAVCCIVLITMVALRTTPSAQKGAEEEIRIKGNGSRLFVYKKDGEAAVLLKTETTVVPNDILQISYIAGGDTYGAILSVDGKGVVTQHFPDSGDTCAKLSPNGEVMLNFSYKLDDAPKFERFIFVSGKEKFSIAQYKKTITRSALKDDKGNFDITGTLPEKAHITDILLLK